MADAVPERIAAKLIARLEEITLANGYPVGVGSVDRVNRDGSDWTPRHLSIVIQQENEQRVPDIDHEGNPPAVGLSTTYIIGGLVRVSDRAGTTQQTLLNNLVASIKKSVSDSSTWYNWDDLAIDSDWDQVDLEESDEGEYTIALVPLVVTYRVSETDPFTVRS